MHHDVFHFGIGLFDRVVHLFRDLMGSGQREGRIGRDFQVHIDPVAEHPGPQQFHAPDAGLCQRRVPESALRFLSQE